MPIEIKELHIKVNVEEPSPERAIPEEGGRRSSRDRDTTVDLCVEKVLEVLKQKNRR